MYALVHFAVAIVAYQLLIARRMVRLLFVINIFKINPMLVEPGANSLPVFFRGYIPSAMASLIKD